MPTPRQVAYCLLKKNPMCERLNMYQVAASCVRSFARRDHQLFEQVVEPEPFYDNVPAWEPVADDDDDDADAPSPPKPVST